MRRRLSSDPIYIEHPDPGSITCGFEPPFCLAVAVAGIANLVHSRRMHSVGGPFVRRRSSGARFLRGGESGPPGRRLEGQPCPSGALAPHVFASSGTIDRCSNRARNRGERRHRKSRTSRCSLSLPKRRAGRCALRNDAFGAVHRGWNGDDALASHRPREVGRLRRRAPRRRARPAARA